MGYPCQRRSKLHHLAMALGDEPTDLAIVDGDDADALAFSSGNPRTDYTTWAAAVKKYGGTVSTLPKSATIAARYPIDVIYPPPTYELSPLFKRAPDAWTNDSAFGYYTAPANVQAYVSSGGITTPQSVPGEAPPPNPNWYDDLLKYGKYAAIAVGIVAAVNVLRVLPHPNPPRRRRRRPRR